MKEEIIEKTKDAPSVPGCVNPDPPCQDELRKVGINRRQFLFYSAGVVSTLALSSIFGASAAFASKATFAKYPRKKIASLADLKADTPIEFLYPNDDATYAQCFLVKLGEKAGGGEEACGEKARGQETRRGRQTGGERRGVNDGS